MRSSELIINCIGRSEFHFLFLINPTVGLIRIDQNIWKTWDSSPPPHDQTKVYMDINSPPPPLLISSLECDL
jgi:hypothetical protein